MIRITNDYDFISYVSYQTLSQIAYPVALYSNRVIKFNKEVILSNKITTFDLYGCFTNYETSDLKNRVLWTGLVVLEEALKGQSIGVLLTAYTNGRIELSTPNNMIYYVGFGSSLKIDFIKSLHLIRYDDFCLVKIVVKDYKNDCYPRRADTEKRWDSICDWWGGKKLIRYPWYFNFIFGGQYIFSDESKIQSKKVSASNLQHYVKFSLDKYKSFGFAKADRIKFEGSDEARKLIEDEMNIICQEYNADKSFFYLFFTKKHALDCIHNMVRLQKKSSVVDFLKSEFYILHNGFGFLNSFYDAIVDNHIVMREWVHRICEKDEFKKYLFHVPIYLKPNGFRGFGFDCIAQTIKKYKDTFPDLFFVSEIRSYFAWENDKLHKQLYPNCKDRPYGPDWFNYLSSGSTAVIFFESNSLDIIRRIVLEARESSQIIWTRNVAHCPEDIFEYYDNLKFFDEINKQYPEIIVAEEDDLEAKLVINE
jgi:hypothetical protein